MTSDQMRGQFWELIGRSVSAGRVPGTPIAGNPTGPSVDDLLNQAILLMCMEAKPLDLRATAQVSLTVATGAGPYSFPADFMDYLHLEEPFSITGLPLRMMRRGQVRRLDAQWYGPPNTTMPQLPLAWYEMGRAKTTPFARTFGVWPVPGATYAMDVDYMRYPITLAAAGAGSVVYPDIPIQFHEAPAYRAAWQFFQHAPEMLPDGKDISGWMPIFQAATDALKGMVNEAQRPTMLSMTPDFMDGPAIDNWMPVS